MAFLQRVLKIQAAVWALAGGAFLALSDTVLGFLDVGISPNVVALARVLGVAAIVLAMLMVLVAQHAGEAWWWAWAFAVLEAGVATICVLHALLGVPDFTSPLPWWLAGLASILFGAADLIGLARAEQERPFT
jgi:hypothetical protein